ncbi:MAG: isoprenylcysteine carboxylmethyltransferase family protein [Bacteroidales bacterium]|nr:isoprenylcysteine carboxylmethyltransferase family protein [Bacteroidales bacterium]
MPGKRNLLHYQDIIAYLLMVICFPLNPLVLAGAVEPGQSDLLFCTGAVVWVAGMVLVIYPFIFFRMKGDVGRGKSYVHTRKLVTAGLYSVVRHVQYTGGIISIFIATPLLYPHWLFVVLGIPGIWLTYLGTRREDHLLVQKFGDEYRKYQDEVPAMNILAGIYRKFRGRSS